jgi:hypothetical protein
MLFFNNYTLRDVFSLSAVMRSKYISSLNSHTNTSMVCLPSLYNCCFTTNFTALPEISVTVSKRFPWAPQKKMSENTKSLISKLIQMVKREIKIDKYGYEVVVLVGIG